MLQLKMETIYPNEDEIKFRNKNYGVIQDMLNVKIECTICNIDLLNDIISKKMIMVHKNYLCLCCYNCYYKLREGNEYSCVLCKSNKELSNCEKCNFNVCNRCIENYKLDRVSNGVLNTCFACTPEILWKQRAKSANVLKIFSSQLDMPNCLFINEIERDQCVRKYLIKEAKIDYNSTIDNIKDHICLDFIFSSYKLNIFKKLSDFSPKIDDYIPINEHFNKFIEIGEHILENTCSTLTNFKRIFNLNSPLNPGVSAIIKSLLKSIDEDDNVLNTPNRNLKINEQNNKTNRSTKIYKIRSSRLHNEENVNDVLKTKTPLSENINMQPLNKPVVKEVAVILERLDDSILSKINNRKLSNNILSNIETDKIVHPLELLNDSSNSDDDNGTQQLRNHNLIETNKKGKKLPKGKSKYKKFDDKSDDEKEINRLINLSNIKSHKKKILSVEEDNDVNEKTNENKSVETSKDNNSIKLSNNSNNEEDKMKLIDQIIHNIDDIDSGSDNNPQSNVTSFNINSIFDETHSTAIPLIDKNNTNSDNSDDSSIDEVINSCLTACNQHGIDYYRTKIKGNKNGSRGLDIISSSDVEIENEENDEKAKSLNRDNSTPIRSIKLVPLGKISSSNDSDSDLITKPRENGKKRKIISSSHSDSSSKYFKKTRSKTKKSDINESIFSSNTESSANYSSSRVQKRKKRIRYISSSLSEDVSDVNDDSDTSYVNLSSKKGRKNIRKLKKKKELSQSTQDALKEEECRKIRIENRQKVYNKIYEIPSSGMESISKLVLDFEPKTKRELVTVHPNLVKLLKPHQVEGIQFLWNSVFESLNRIKTSKGNGSILAHCMGLGKTLQVITLIHTLFRYPETGIKTVLIITPHAIIENWCKEFHKWLKHVPEKDRCAVFNFTETKTYNNRKYLLQNWKENKGVLITSYQLYRTILTYQKIKKFPTILEGLVDPGPDMVICDEGHVLKNQSTAISKALSKIKTLRRIILTGTPLQNNLKEYHCMVDFIRPNLLGSIKDFTNRFVNPITNGQYSDSTLHDVRLMKRRSYVLHRMLEGFIQRFDYSVLTPYLPPKHEYVIYLKMSNIQIQLYRVFLDNYKQNELFTNYNILQMIWTHPKLLPLYAKRIENKKEKEILKDFVNDDSSTSVSNSNSSEEHDENEAVPISVLDITKAKIPEMDLYWWKPILLNKNLNTVYPYSKFIMMFSILKECEEIGDKVLLFSQSLYTLDLIQNFLENTEDLTNDKDELYGESWIHGQDFFRIDGNVSLKNREDYCTKFNDVTNTQLRLLLLSTKAFNLGINLVGANRVIIFDVTWNPSLNVQSIFRVFRFGQTKPCYIYRLISEGTMEQKIYERQISKLSMAFRVVDEHQIDRHFNAKDQEILYEFDPKSEPKTTLNLPKDYLMAELILKHKDLVIDILEHDSLLQNNEAEELNDSDRKAAWEDYQKEKNELNQPPHNIQLQMNDQLYSFDLNMHQNQILHTEPGDITLFNTLKTYFPQANMLQLNNMLNQVKRVQDVRQ